jgi:hypothetical protein
MNGPGDELARGPTVEWLHALDKERGYHYKAASSGLGGGG